MVMWLSRLLDEVGVGRFHLLQNLLLGGVLIADGAEMLVSSSVIGAMLSMWDVPEAQRNMLRGCMMSIIFLGVLLGGLVGGVLADSLGRRAMVLISYVGIIVCGTTSATTSGPAGMLTLRLLLGCAFGTGIGPTIALVVESAPTEMRAHLVNATNTWFIMGQAYAACLLMIFMPELTDETGWAWRKVVLCAALPSVLLLPFNFLCLQESPHYLLQKGRRSEALAAVAYIATVNGQTEELIDHVLHFDEAVCAHLLRPPPRSSSPVSSGSNPQEDEGGSEKQQAVSVAQVPEEEEEEQKGLTLAERLQIALSPDFRKIVIGGCYMCFLSNFLFYGLNYALPQVFKGVEQDYHLSMSPAAELLVATLMDVPAILLTVILLKSSFIGHRDGLFWLMVFTAPMQLLMCGLDIPAMIRLAFFGTYMSKLGVAAIFGLSYIYLGEVFPQACRCTALSLCVATGRVAAIVAPLTYEWCLKLSPPDNTHLLYFSFTATLCLIGLFVVRLCLTYELKNSPLEPVAVARRKSIERSSFLRRTSSNDAAMGATSLGRAIEQAEDESSLRRRSL